VHGMLSTELRSVTNDDGTMRSQLIARLRFFLKFQDFP